MSNYSSSPWFSRLSLSPDSHMDSFGTFVTSSSSFFSLFTRGPLRRRFIANGFPIGGKPSRGQSGMVGRGSSFSSGTACILPAAGDDGQEKAGVVEVLRECRPVVVARTGKSTEVVGLRDNSQGCDCGAVQAGGSAGSRDRGRCLTGEIGFRMSRLNGSSRVSFGPQHNRPTEPNSEFHSGPSTQFGHDEQDDRSESEGEVMHMTGDHEGIGSSPLVVHQVKNSEEG